MNCKECPIPTGSACMIALAIASKKDRMRRALYNPSTALQDLVKISQEVVDLEKVCTKTSQA